MRRAQILLLMALAACFGSLSPDRTPTGVDLPNPPGPIPPPPGPLPPPSPIVAKVTVTGPSTIRVGGNAQLGVTLYDSAGSVIAAPYRPYYSSFNGAVATVNDLGLVTAHSKGYATIVVSGLPVRGEKLLQVTD